MGTMLPVIVPQCLLLHCRNLYVCIASAFGVSLAIENTHVAENIGELFISASSIVGGKVSKNKNFLTV